MKDLAEKIVSALMDQIEADQAVIKDKAVERVSEVLASAAAQSFVDGVAHMLPSTARRKKMQQIGMTIEQIRDYERGHTDEELKNAVDHLMGYSKSS